MTSRQRTGNDKAMLTRIAPEQWEALQAAAAREHTTVADLVRSLIRQYLSQEERTSKTGGTK